MPRGAPAVSAAARLCLILFPDQGCDFSPLQQVRAGQGWQSPLCYLLQVLPAHCHERHTGTASVRAEETSRGHGTQDSRGRFGPWHGLGNETLLLNSLMNQLS